MSSPPPIDPYLALGVAKDADIATVRKAHHKLVLKLHPDRIRVEAEKARGKDEFQKVQRAYELLSDPAKRARYDDKVKLAELRREAMAKDPPPPTRTATYPMRPPPQSFTREYRDGTIVEERAPSASYFDEHDRYAEEPQRASSRKYDGYERTSSIQRDEREKRATKWQTQEGMPLFAGLKLKKVAEKARERVKEKGGHNATAKSRDQERRRESVDKRSTRRAYVEDESSSDSDTVVSFSRQKSRSARSPYQASPQSRPKPEAAPKREPRSSSKYDDNYEDEWERRHGSAREYIGRASQRPHITRADSSNSYWESRRDDSDSDRRPRSPRTRRTSIDNPKVRPPPLASHNSAPANLKKHVEERGVPLRSSTGISRDHRREMPSMSRNNTMPAAPTRSRHDSAPKQSSRLRNGETHDSGYGSSSSPHTPELHGTSPPKSRMPEIVDEAEEHYQDRRFYEDDDEDDDRDRHRKARDFSPPRERREPPKRPTISTHDSRPRPSRGATYAHSPVETHPARPASLRHDSARTPQVRGGSPRDSSPLPRGNSGRGEKLFGEVEERASEKGPIRYTYAYPPEKISSAPRVRAQDVNYGRYERRPSAETEREYHLDSRYRDQFRQAGIGSRRPSVPAAY